ncbi:MAG: STAS domain-containing protein [Blastocatellia bacterium]|nr:STAS domain-containing protein [Blastocatellia bacterium]
MLRMDLTETDVTTTIHVEGRIVGNWVDELRRVCVEQLGRSKNIVLDVSEVAFIDEYGVETIETLTRNHVQVVGGSLFLNEYIEKTSGSFQMPVLKK